jgi:exonuclease VII small subunit
MIESRRLSKELEEARERLEKILMERIEEMNEEEEEIEVL